MRAVLAEYSSTVSPGIAGFLVTFALALATWLLIRSMVGRIRRLRYTPDPAARPDPELADQQEPDREPPGREQSLDLPTQKKATQQP